MTKKIDLDDEKELLQTLQNHHTVNVHVKTSLELGFDSLKDCSAYIESCIFQIKDIIELYQKNEIQKGNTQFPNIIDSIDFFVRLITKVHRTILSHQKSSHKTLSNHIQNLETHLLAALKTYFLPKKKKISPFYVTYLNMSSAII